MECVLCGAEIEPHRDGDGNIFWEGGHNAEPLAEGSCCDSCQPKVLELRLKFMRLNQLTKLEREHEKKRKKTDPSWDKWDGWEE